MKKHIKILTLLIILFHISYSQVSLQELNCFSILVGKEASVDGSVLFAHNEDDWGDRIVNWYKVPASEEQQPDLSIEKILQPGPSADTWSYLWLEMPEMEFSDTYMNQWGVTISSDACASREENPDLTDGGIGYLLRMNMARQARSSREAVQIGGKMIEAYGYTSSGRTYCIADPDETWMLAVVHGKHWVAQRVPDNHVAIIPNYYTISNVDLEDTLNFLGSENLIDYATECGWYNPETEEAFSFRKAYGDPESLSNMVNIVRHWSALNILAEREYELDEEFPFSFAPKKRVELSDLFRILRNHNEGTIFDYSENYTLGNPHSFEKTICAETTQYGFVAQLRRNLPPETGLVMWLAPFRPCVHPFVPWYFGVTEIPEGFFTGNYTTALETHFEPIEDVFEFAPENSFLKFVKHAREIDDDYNNRIGMIRRDIESFEIELLRNQLSFETNTTQMYGEKPLEAERIINGYVSAQIMLSLEMIREH
jgi:dipeptidase